VYHVKPNEGRIRSHGTATTIAGIQLNAK